MTFTAAVYRDDYTNIEQRLHNTSVNSGARDFQGPLRATRGHGAWPIPPDALEGTPAFFHEKRDIAVGWSTLELIDPADARSGQGRTPGFCAIIFIENCDPPTAG